MILQKRKKDEIVFPKYDESEIAEVRDFVLQHLWAHIMPHILDNNYFMRIPLNREASNNAKLHA